MGQELALLQRLESFSCKDLDACCRIWSNLKGVIPVILLSAVSFTQKHVSLVIQWTVIFLVLGVVVVVTSGFLLAPFIILIDTESDLDLLILGLDLCRFSHLGFLLHHCLLH